MDPQAIGPEQWARISHMLTYLYLFTGLGLTSALGFLFGHAIIPSLVASRDMPPALGTLRWLAYPLSGVALALMLYALIQGVRLALEVMRDVYPRMWI
jgi:hypothetical protein